MDTKVILLSGGINSCLAAMLAKQDSDIAALHMTYGQRSANRDRDCFESICQHLDIKQRLMVTMSQISSIGGSGLLDKRIQLEDALAIGDEIPKSYVPFRNAQLFSAGVAWAEVIGATKVVAGCVDDHPNYPDNHREFVHVFNQLIRYGAREDEIELQAPLMHLKPGEIVRLAHQMEVPLAMTWSCLRSEVSPCGACAGCSGRAKAFKAVGADDPLLQEAFEAEGGW